MLHSSSEFGFFSTYCLFVMDPIGDMLNWTNIIEETKAKIATLEEMLEDAEKRMLLLHQPTYSITPPTPSTSSKSFYSDTQAICWTSGFTSLTTNTVLCSWSGSNLFSLTSIPRTQNVVESINVSINDAYPAENTDDEENPEDVETTIPTPLTDMT
nr:hypothetical protein Iba_chr12eCG9100 [Ipomoea batatas]GMD72673.1 hypothetical protein Iba_chr12fCG10880 [Ipomoea batatas]